MINLPVLNTKFSKLNLRYLSQNGKFAYTQNTPGTLSLVKNFKTTEVLPLKSQLTLKKKYHSPTHKSSRQSQFLVHGSNGRKKLIIEEIHQPHRQYNPYAQHSIYIVGYGDASAIFIGKGRYPKLHLDDRFLSYFEMTEKKMVVIDISSITSQQDMKKKKEIIAFNLAAKEHPLFIPEVLMINEDKILYSDINSEGVAGLRVITISHSKNSTLLKSSFTGTRFEMCQSGRSVFIGEFPYEGVQQKSLIKIINTLKIQEAVLVEEEPSSTLVYESPLPDLGHLICEKDSLYFIKTMTYDSKFNRKVTEVAHLSYKSDKKKYDFSVQTHLNHVTSLIQMDGRVLVPFRGEHYVLKGLADMSRDSLTNLKNLRISQ